MGDLKSEQTPNLLATVNESRVIFMRAFERSEFWSTLVALPAVFAMLASSALGQALPTSAAPPVTITPNVAKYKPFPRPAGIDDKTYRAYRTRVPALCKLGNFESPDDRVILRDYFLIRIADLTDPLLLSGVVDPKQGQVKIRNEIKTYLVSAGTAPRPEVHDAINQLLLSTLPNLIKSDDYHPAARNNATIMLADLCQVEPVLFGAMKRPPVPYPPALPILVELAKDAKLHEAVRAPALAGVQRFVKFNAVPQGARAIIVADLVATLKETPGMGEEFTPSQSWRMNSSAETLQVAVQSWPEANTAAVAQAIFGVVANPKAWIDARMTSSTVLGLMESRAIPPNEVTNMVRAIGELAVSQTDPSSEIMMLANPPVAPAGAPAPPVAPTAPLVPTKALANALMYRLECLKLALTGSGPQRGLAYAAANDADTKKLIVSLTESLMQIMAVVPKFANKTGLDLATNVGLARAPLVQLFPPKAVQPAANVAAGNQGAEATEAAEQDQVAMP